jgi:hypothetical protein
MTSYAESETQCLLMSGRSAGNGELNVARSDANAANQTAAICHTVQAAI